ncbi:hypothetical protein ACMFMF_001314 [Clarireedia jacksonii]
MSSSDDPGFISTPAGFNLATDGKPAGEHSNELEWVEWTPELERKNSKGGVSKNYHKKVRTGCLRCRARRVKCDEGHPICSNCKRHDTPCKYDPFVSRKAATHSKLSASSSSQASETPERRLQELALLHHFTTRTSLTLSLQTPTHPDPSGYEIFRQTIPSLALTNEALLYSIYCLSSIHISFPSQSSSSPSPSSSSSQSTPLPLSSSSPFDLSAHHYLSRTIHHHLIDASHLTPENADAISLTSSHIRIAAFALLQSRSLTPYIFPHDWLRITRGASQAFSAACRCISNTATTNDDDDDANVDASANTNTNTTTNSHINISTSTAWKFIHRTPILASPCTIFHDPLNSVRFAHFLRRRPHDMSNEPWDATTQEAYRCTVCLLGYINRQIQDAAAPPTVCRLLIGFPYFITQGYLELVDEQRPRAMVLAGVFFAMLVRFRRIWWIGESGEREVRGILGGLGTEWDDLKGEVREIMHASLEGVYDFM